MGKMRDPSILPLSGQADPKGRTSAEEKCSCQATTARLWLKKRAVEKTCKPDSVPSGICSHTVVIISLGSELPRTSSDLPEDLGRASRSPFPESRNDSCLPIWPCIERRLPCRRCHHPRGGLLPHRFTLTWSAATWLGSHRLGHRRSVLCGAGVGSLRLGVTQRSAPEVRTFLSPRHRNERSPGLLPRACSV